MLPYLWHKGREHLTNSAYVLACCAVTKNYNFVTNSRIWNEIRNETVVAWKQIFFRFEWGMIRFRFQLQGSQNIWDTSIRVLINSDKKSLKKYLDYFRLLSILTIISIFTKFRKFKYQNCIPYTVETYKSLQGKSLQNFKSLRFLVIFPMIFQKITYTYTYNKIILNRYGFLKLFL